MNTATALRRRGVEVIQFRSTSPESESDAGSYQESESENEFEPFSPPTFKLSELLDCIPKHCFERNATISFLYLSRSFAFLVITIFAALYIDANLGLPEQGLIGTVAKWTAWNVYWICAGLVATGIWVIAHECGHQAFSESKALNNSVGLVLHSLLLVPYHSWRITHAAHHAGTSHLTKEQVFVPPTRSTIPIFLKKFNPKEIMIDGVELDEILEDAPFYRLLLLVFQQTAGWLAYLATNVTGQETYPLGTNHFSPASVLFNARQRNGILLSDAALALVFGGLYLLSQKIGIAGVVKYYGIPYIYVNHWLVMITYLQHTDPSLPHYRAAEWTFSRGALATIDRTFLGPFIGPILLFGIAETHTAHHLVSRIPHHHAWEATEALKIKLGSHYSSSTENVFITLWNNFRRCRFIEDEGDIVFFKDSYGRVARKLKENHSDSGVEMSN